MLKFFKNLCLFAILSTCMLFPRVTRAAEIEKFFIDLSFAPPHNEIIGVNSEVDRYKAEINFRFSIFENKDGLGLLGAELMPKYYWGGYWLKQREKWSSGTIQRLEIHYRVFVRPLKWLEIFSEHYENYLTDKGKFKTYNFKVHNLFGLRFIIVEE